MKYQVLRSTQIAVVAVLLFVQANIFAQGSAQNEQMQNGNTIYLHPANGDDGYAGTKENPLRTLAAAAKKVNESSGTGAITIVLAEGVYAMNETAAFQPTNRTFTTTARLTIRAEVLPDDPEWHTGRMPTIIHTMPLSDTWMGRKDPFGGVSYGMMIETSHVTIQGLKILGIPVVEHPREGYIQRVYPIGRMNPGLDDLVITQCLFAGDEVTNPNHLPILANGTGIVLDHCIFYNVKQAIVYWSRNSTGHAMRNCLIYGSYGCGIWTSAIANDFDFRNNIIANGNYVWISQTTRDRGQQETGSGERSEPILYKVHNSLFAGNKKLTGTGGGPALNFRDIEPSILELNNTKVTDETIELEMDQSKRNYLHPVAGSAGEAIGAGLFKEARYSKSWTDMDYVGDAKEYHKLDIYLPVVSKPAYPAVIAIYGSAWFRNDLKSVAFRIYGKHLLANGFALITVNHRSSRDAIYPAQINDIKAAVRFIRANAKEYKIDDSFIGVTGFSSGGHLAALLGTSGGVGQYTVNAASAHIEGYLGTFTESSSSVDAVVDWFGPTAFQVMDSCANSTAHDAPDSPESSLIGGPIQENIDKCALADPITYVDANDPPFLILHGDADSLVPQCQSALLYRALQEKGVKSELVLVPGAGHGPGLFEEEYFIKMVDFFVKESGK